MPSHIPQRILSECHRPVSKFIRFKVVGDQFIDCSDSVVAFVGETIESLFEFAPPGLFRLLCERFECRLRGLANALAGEDEVIPPNR